MIKKENNPISMRTRLVLALSAIAAVLSIAAVISIIEYRRMSDYVSRSLLEDMERSEAAEKLADASRKYNLNILSAVGAADSLIYVNFDRRAALAECDSVAKGFSQLSQGMLADTVMTRYSRFAEKSNELDKVIVSDFVDSRAWFFESLQPDYNGLIHAIRDYRDDINTHLMISADDFQDGFYRGIIPGVVVTVAGLLLIALLLFFILAFYVQPLRKMLFQLEAFNKDGIKKYNVDFDGNDELSRLNAGIRDLADENIQLKRRLRSRKEE